MCGLCVCVCVCVCVGYENTCTRQDHVVVGKNVMCSLS